MTEDEIPEAGDALDLALIALGWVRGAFSDWDDETMGMFFDHSQHPANMIAGLTNLNIYLIDWIGEKLDMTHEEIMNHMAMGINSMDKPKI